MNKRKPLLFTILFLFALQLKADYYAPAQNAKTHLWGYINQDGKNVTEFKYRLAFNFSFNKAIVLRDKWYYLDKENLKEHVFDDSLQKYFSSIIRRLLVSEKLKYYNDTNYRIVNMLTPPRSALFGNEFEAYYYFHFAADNLIQMENIPGDNHRLYEEDIYSFYNINKGHTNEFKQVKIISPMVNNRFLGVKGLFNSKKVFAKMDDELWGVYDTSGNLILSLDSIKDKMILAMKNARNDYGCPDESDYLLWASCMDLSPDCMKITISVALYENKSCRELAPFETAIIFNISKKISYSSKLNNLYSFKKEILDECKCRAKADIEKYDSMMNKLAYKKYGPDSLSYAEIYYNDFYREEYSTYKKDWQFYSFRRPQNQGSSFRKWEYLWGICDGQKVLTEPKYELLGVFK